MSQRDPRTDPKMGDVMCLRGWAFTVEVTESNLVSALKRHARTGKEPYKKEYNFDLMSWRMRMAKARVVAMGITAR